MLSHTPIRRLLTAALICAPALLSAQNGVETHKEANRQAEPEQSKTYTSPDGVQRTELSSEEITLWKDSDRQLPSQTSVADELRGQYQAGGNRADMDQIEDNTLQGKVNRIRVISPKDYAALSEAEQETVDADPLYYVTPKSRREMVAQFLSENIRRDGGAPKPATPPASTFPDTEPETPAPPVAPAPPEKP